MVLLLKTRHFSNRRASWTPWHHQLYECPSKNSEQWNWKQVRFCAKKLKFMQFSHNIQLSMTFLNIPCVHESQNFGYQNKRILTVFSIIFWGCFGFCFVWVSSCPFFQLAPGSSYNRARLLPRARHWLGPAGTPPPRGTCGESDQECLASGPFSGIVLININAAAIARETCSIHKYRTSVSQSFLLIWSMKHITALALSLELFPLHHWFSPFLLILHHVS